MFASNDELFDACHQYDNVKWWTDYIKIIAGGFITGANTISKMVIIWIISVLGAKSKTYEAIGTFVYLFAVTAFSSIFIWLLLGAKLDFMPIIGEYFKDGKFRDFTWDWYKELGGLFILKTIIMTFGQLSFISEGLIQNARRWWFNRNAANEPPNDTGKTMW